MKFELPANWAYAKLEDLSTYVLGGDWGKDENFESNDYSLALCIRGAEFRNWTSDKGCTASLRRIKNSSLVNRKLEINDILVEISGGGPEQPVGRTVLIEKSVLSYKPELPKVCTNFLRLFRPTPNVNAGYLNLFLSFFYSSGEIRDYQSGSNNLRNLKFNDYLKIEIPTPPLTEQHRIVAKIEELFSELDQGIDNLKTAQAQLKVYRQALLKHAFEGKLTAEWRAQNADKLESASVLQQRIQHAREQRYQQQLAEWQANGKKGTKPKAPKPIAPLTAEELAELPELPLGWGWFKLENLADVSGGLTKNQKRNTLPIRRPFLRVANVYANRLELSDMHEIGISESEIDRVLLVKGDILVVEGNGSVDQIGRVAIWDDSIQGCVHQNHLIKARPLNAVFSDFILHFLMSEFGRKLIVMSASSTSGLHTLSISKVENLFIPFCIKEEQGLLLTELSSKLTLIESLNQTITTSLQQAEALRQSILKKAFSGELVPQNIEDEPASILLEKIKAEKARQQTSTAKARSKKAKPPKDNVVPFPTKVPAIDTTELHAGLMALAYRCHEQHKTSWYFGHVKAEKISHMIESFIGIDLERMPIQDAAGPNDFKRLLEVESLARQKQWFDVRKQPNGRYFLIKLSGFDALIQRTEKALGKQLEKVNALIKLFVNLDTTSSEIVATLFAAWNNLLLSAHKPNDEEIVLEARERWHEDKLKIRKERFSRCLIWMRKHGLVPLGRGAFVAKKSQRNVPKKLTDSNIIWNPEEGANKF